MIFDDEHDNEVFTVSNKFNPVQQLLIIVTI